MRLLKNKFFLVFLLLIMMLGCSKEEAAAFFPLNFMKQKEELRRYDESRFLFGTYVKIMLYSTSEAKAKEAMELAFQEIDRIDQAYNSKTENSLIQAWNQGENPIWPEEALGLWNGVLEAHRVSDSYDPSIAPLLDLWGFGEENPSIPSAAAIKACQKRIGMEDLQMKDGHLERRGSKDIVLDTGSFLKGYALHRAKEVLVAQGVTSAYISAISSIEVIGAKPGDKPWRIALEDPRNSEDILGILDLKDRAVGVTGDYQTFVVIDGKKYHHILDKKTGYPVSDKKMVVLLCDDAFSADLYSTALFLMPTPKALEYVNKRGDMEAMIVGNDGKEYKSNGFDQYFSKK